jgi:hypothetical protein
MNCIEVAKNLDEYLENLPGEGLDDAEAGAIALHIQSCPACAKELEHRESLRQDLQAIDMPAPRPGFLEQAVAKAAASADQAQLQSATRQPHSNRFGGALMALAAALVAAVLIGSVMTHPVNPAPETTLQAIHLATNTVTPVKLAFSSETALEDARLSLSLPVGVELMGYDGRTDLSWNTDLEEGTNVLRLPLIGRMAASDVLIARLEHPSGAKTFRLPVTVNE